jgi:hypothetical protein
MGRGDAPNRATEIKLADAQLTTSGNRVISVNGNELGSAANANPVAIRYDAPGDTRLVYEYGAVIRVDGDSAIMRREPDFLFMSDTIVIRYISLRGAGQGLGGTASTALVRAEKKQSRVLVNRGSTTDLEISIQTRPERATVWTDYLTDHMSTATGTTPSCTETTMGSDTVKVTCTGGSVSELAVSRVTIDVTLT